MRIRRELQEKGVPEETVERWLDPAAREWTDAAVAVRRRKFGGRPPKGLRERARQMRFLQYRGFTSDQIQQALNPPK